MTLELASYKLRFHEGHVRAVPSRDEAGCLFEGPGVDLRGDDARSVLDLADGVRRWLEAREPGITLRSMSVDLRAPRVLVTLEALEASERPRVLRFDPPYAQELVAAAAELEAQIAVLCARALRRRRDGRAEEGRKPSSA
ncbi:MAG: hypothetical protein KF819_00340 [Labilithrix sp.]|nr:hypothetical protein [Labilithrix sp.]